MTNETRREAVFISIRWALRMLVEARDDYGEVLRQQERNDLCESIMKLGHVLDATWSQRTAAEVKE